MRKLLTITGILISGIFLVSITLTSLEISPREMFAGIYFVESTTTAELQTTYNNAKRINKPFSILVVPGHTKTSGGTNFRGVSEADINVEIGTLIVTELNRDPAISAKLARTDSGFAPELQNYFDTQREDILNFANYNKSITSALMKNGLIDSRKNVEHLDAPANAVIQLYGINKWANENSVDLVIHIHFNDHPGRRYNLPGKYSGFAIYVPESQYSNAKVSQDVALSISEKLKGYSAVSDMPKESAVVEDQELIAIGSNNTLDPAGILIEYGYIYESQYYVQEVRGLAFQDLAVLTAQGVFNFLNSSNINSDVFMNTPKHIWATNLSVSIFKNRDVYALQAFLNELDLYPPKGKALSACPLSGNFGPCTQKSVIEFQREYNITPAIGFVGEKTRAVLNSL